MDLEHTGMSELTAADLAYQERNQVVAALARVFPSGLRKTDIEGWDPAWHNCVFIDLPTGQVSWHFHDREAPLFAGLPPYEKPWDGHSTPEKYLRLAALGAEPEKLVAPAGAAPADGALAEVIDLDAHRPGWVNWWAICVACGADRIVFCHHEDAKPPFECPKCHEPKLVRACPAE